MPPDEASFDFMKVLQVHVRYQVRGGEDEVVDAERLLLQKYGVDVELIEWENRKIKGVLGKVRAALAAVFSISAYRKICAAIHRFKPDVIHVHNFHPLASPSVFYAAKHSGAPCVLTLHNFRIICPTATLSFNGRICERSVHCGPWWTLRHKVFRGSYMGTAVLCLSISLHRTLGTWNRVVTRFISPTAFGADIFARWGISRDAISIKPNFAEDMDIEERAPPTEPYMVFVGRLSEEKGLLPLMEAWREIDYSLKIVGDGPLGDTLLERAGPKIEIVGRLSRQETRKIIAGARALIMPSTWYETFGMVIVEAFSAGVPVICSNIGAMAELVSHGRNGLHCIPGDVEDLRHQIKALISDPAGADAMGAAARKMYLNSFTPETNFSLLIKIYAAAMKDVQAQQSLLPEGND